MCFGKVASHGVSLCLVVSDMEELSVLVTAVPSKTKSMTEWGVRILSVWVSSRTVTPAPDRVVIVVVDHHVPFLFYCILIRNMHII